MKFDERAIKIALTRLEREIKTKKNNINYLMGYHEAISDFIWDYTKTPLKSIDWDLYLDELRKKNKIKLQDISIKGVIE